MVFFSCGACNEVLKGKAVPGHLPRCSYPQLSCVDCGGAFDSSTYKAHTSCITEDQKHKVAGAGSKQKKVDPQEIWTASIAKAAAAAPAGSNKSLLERLIGHGNVPRKFKPFVNFAKNSLRVHNEAGEDGPRTKSPRHRVTYI